MKNIFIKNKNVKLRVRIYSENKTETIILLHGGPGIPDKMEKIVSVLKTKYKIITFDQRGTGETICDNCDFSIMSYISDIENIINFFDIHNFHLFGYSWGGLYAQIYTNLKPEKINSLFLCSSLPATSNFFKKAEKEILIYNIKKSPNKVLLTLFFNSIFALLGSDKSYKKMFEIILKNYCKNDNNLEFNYDVLNNINAKSINKTRQNIIKYPQINKLYNPNFPILITYGDDDNIIKHQKYILSKYPTAKYQIIEKSGHCPWFQNANKFKQILIEFYNL